MFHRRFFHVRCAPLDDAGSTGGAAGAGDGAGGAGAGSDNGASAGGSGDAGAGSALAMGAAAGAGAGDGGGAGAAAAGASSAAGEAAPEIPEKFVVKGADGQIDHAATALKVAQAYGHLERRQGTGDVRPAKAEDYKITVPESLADRIHADELKTDAGFQGFLAKMHEAGASQSVVDAAVAEMLTRGVAMREAGPALSQAECIATLRQVDGWKTEAELQRNMTSAYRAAERVFGADLKGMMETYGNDPKFVQAMARLWPEMAEDTGGSPEARQHISESIETLQRDEAYLNDRHPRHKDVLAKVQAMQEQLTRGRTVERGMTIKI